MHFLNKIRFYPVSKLFEERYYLIGTTGKQIFGQFSQLFTEKSIHIYKDVRKSDLFKSNVNITLI